MTHRKPDSTVPAIERRSRRRIVTLRNVRNAFFVGLVIVAALNIRSEMRDSTGSEDYGRLFEQDISKAPQPEATAASAKDVAAVDEAASADPFALDAARREQYLGRPTLEPVPLIEPAPTTASVYSPSQGSAVRIVGGPEGVTLVHEEKRRGPALGGGFGRH